MVVSKTDSTQSRPETLSNLNQLKTLIQKKRASLVNGKSDPELAAELDYWMTIVEKVQHQFDLQKDSRLELLYDISQRLNASLDWKETLEAVMEAVIQLTGAERGMLLLLQEETKQLEVMLKQNATGEDFTEEDMKFSYSIVQQALEQGEPVLTTNAQVDPRFKGSESIIAYGLRSILCTPLIAMGTPIGVIYLDNRAQAGIFGQDDLNMLSAFANQAAIALDNAHTHHKTDQELTNRVRELTLLQEMARDLNAGLNFEHVMERSVSWMITAAGGESGALALVSEEGIRWVAKIGEITPLSHVAQQCLNNRHPVSEAGILVIPLMREERPIGICYLNTGKDHFSTRRLEFVMRVGDNAAIAVENARLYEALRQANEAKSEFVSLVSHELRTPMTSIRGYADMLNKGMIGELAPQQKEFVEAIQRNVDRMRVLVSDLLDISRIETGRLKLQPRPITIKETLDDALRTVEQHIQEKEQVFIADIWEHLPRAYADPDRITQVFINFLSNAAKYTPHKGTIAVRAWVSPAEPTVIRCAIVDSGIGISPEDQRHMFNKFFRSDNPEVREQPGTGLGLAITKNLVEMHGGRVWLESEKDKGSTFFFTVPIAVPTAGEML
ncbi:MAG: GAF domain-containing protein [Anaerolineae bacterium]|nr:GAF domain-containing protein [Anaerolineae bacterium]